MNELQKRIAGLTPERLAALAVHLGKKKVDAPRDQTITRRAGEGPCTLSFAQQRLWFIDQFEPSTPAYNIPAAVRIRSALNVEAFRRSMDEIVRRHDSLRTTFAAVGGEPVQVVSPHTEFEMPLFDLRALPEAERAAETKRLVKEEAYLPFDLSAGPLVRVKLLWLEEEQYVLLLTMHHIVSDGWSAGVFFRELRLLYEAFNAGRPSPLPELPIQYADFAVWQRDHLQGEELERHLSYWKRQLAGAPAFMELPFDRPRQKVRNLRGATQDFLIPAELAAPLKEMTRQGEATMFMTLLAAFQLLLSRLTNSNDIVVGTNVANRNRPEIEGLIGFFINQLVMRTDLSGNPTFRELLARVREAALGAYAHQDMPFDKLVDAVNPERRLSHTPLFQVLFVLQNMPMADLEGAAGLVIKPLESDSGTSKFDLSLFMMERGDVIVGAWRYNTDLFDASTVSAFSSQLQALLANIAANPDAAIDTLEVLTEEEKRRRDAELEARKASQVRKLRSVRREAVNLSRVNPVRKSYLEGAEGFPLVIEPTLEEVDAAGWVANNLEEVNAELLKHGAVLFRGFKLGSAQEFERFAGAACRQLFGEYGDLPREEVSSKVYGSTPYPQDQPILFHSESSHLHEWPMKIWFCCVTAAEQGGETPIVDCRRIYRMLDPKLRERFERKHLLYVRNYTEALDVDWRTFFHTDDRAAVEETCRRAGVRAEWKDGGDVLMTSQMRQAVARHPKTGEATFFNQFMLHHVACLAPGLRQSMLSVFDERDLPRNVYYGDGSVIDDSVVEEVRAVYEKAMVAFRWQEGDVLMLDNMLTAHARLPYVGARKILVAMGEMTGGGAVNALAAAAKEGA
jgi:alpha-ketoglutarate-dependent taurine dioxygenase